MPSVNFEAKFWIDCNSDDYEAHYWVLEFDRGNGRSGEDWVREHFQTVHRYRVELCERLDIPKAASMQVLVRGRITATRDDYHRDWDEDLEILSCDYQDWNPELISSQVENQLIALGLEEQPNGYTLD